MGTWNNSDGLFVKLGSSESGTSGLIGEVPTLGPDRQLEYVVNLTTLTASAVIQDDNTELGIGARVNKIEIITETAATSGGSATLNIGLMGSDRTTNLSDTALVSALAVATIAAVGTVTVITVGVTGAGSSLGVTLATLPKLITAKYGTAAFTAGRIRVRIHYLYP